MQGEPIRESAVTCGDGCSAIRADRGIVEESSESEMGAERKTCNETMCGLDAPPPAPPKRVRKKKPKPALLELY
ncbi:hypothetical protein E2562_012264 [Oryza meyeriana var. granulata]|uniref:Uncharacterized protein n=1 Tax=Oryza meyeriana var. granulata TaxID=110450 RepID=A0A6G1DH53_9ORYZ|nr:hypothetical protein E2562_012264 [Oryza meyeriana var. granulata]